MELTIPDGLKNEVRKMAEIGMEARQALISALDSAPPAASLPQIEAYLVANTGISRQHVQATISVALSVAQTNFRGGATGEQVGEFAASIASTAAHVGLLESTEEHVVEGFLRFILGLLERASIFVLASGITSLIYEQDKIYQDADIVTDFRPLFVGTPDEPKGLEAGAIVHTLRLGTKSLTGEGSHVYISLDILDLMLLRDVLNSAIAKERLLRESLAKLDIPIHNLREGHVKS